MADSSLHQKRKNTTDDGSLSSKRSRLYESNIVTLKTGKLAQISTVHEALLKDNSEFFRAALENQWKESQTRVIELPTDRHDVVVAYVHYLYCRAIEVDTPENGKTSYTDLARLYCFGEKIRDDAFCDAVMRALFTACGETDKLPSAKSISIMFAGTPAGSPMRDFIIHLIAKCLIPDTGGLSDPYCEFPQEFLQGVIVEMCKLRPASDRVGFETGKEKWLKKKG